ncbi:MAG: undecaprenyl-diphosphate phosphatase [Planctomycetes bacterium]|nr:undecaprenyl-diphosphate phosphatase [Planctomycetota bacterium]
MTWWEALILGVIQGLTEFFPVSSSGHLVMASSALGLKLPGIVFEVVVHVATLASVVIVYRRRIGRLLAGLVGHPGGDEHARSFVLMLLLASLPAGMAGILWKDWFEARFDDPAASATMVLATGCIVWSIRWARESVRLSPLEFLPLAAAAGIALLAGTAAVFLGVLAVAAVLMGVARAAASRRWHDRPTAADALLMGIGQALAILPGVSRSGTTVMVGIWRRVDSQAAAEFSFLMSVIAISGAGLLMIPDAVEAGASIGPVPVLVGCVAALISGILAIRFFLAMLRRQSFHLFAWYCWAVGALYLLVAR